jgi:hypothetical protein
VTDKRGDYQAAAAPRARAALISWFRGTADTLLRRADRTLLVWAAIGTAVMALSAASALATWTSGDFGTLDPSTVEPTTEWYGAGRPARTGGSVAPQVDLPER